MTEKCVERVTTCLQQYGWQPLWVDQRDDVLIHDLVIQIYSATVSTPEMRVFDAWITDGGGMMHCVNTTTFPTFNDVIAYHLGKLLVDGPYKLVFEPNGPAVT